MDACSQPESTAAAGTLDGAAPRVGARDAIVRALKARFIALGWKVVQGNAQVELECFEHLLPAADTTFTVIVPGDERPCPVALYFAEGENALRYACTMRRTNGEFTREHGQLDFATGTLKVDSTRGDWNVAPADCMPASTPRKAERAIAPTVPRPASTLPLAPSNPGSRNVAVRGIEEVPMTKPGNASNGAAQPGKSGRFQNSPRSSSFK